MDSIKAVIKNVTEYEYFKTVDELNESSRKLAEQYPDLASFYKIGESMAGDPIYCLKIGNGSRAILMYGFPHPNEPIGSMMLDYLSQQLVENEAFRNTFKDVSWYIVKVADNDGAKLNEGWFKGPYTPLNYALNFYRPASFQQVEWTFPIKYKTLDNNDPIPETRALMNIIEEVKPIFIYSLHNAGFGGVYNYISDDAPILYPIFEKAYEDQNIPAALGEPEMPYAVKFAEAVFKMPTMRDTYDYYAANTDRDPAEIIGKAGTCSYEYGKQFNEKVFELVCEVPYYYNPKIEDLSETEFIRRDLVLANIEDTKLEDQKIREIYFPLKDRLVVDTPLRTALDDFLESSERHLPVQENWAKTAKELEKKATVAEAFDNQQVSKTYKMLLWGMLRRIMLLNYEKTNDGEFKAAAEKAYRHMKDMSDKLEKELEYTIIPIKKLVQIQLMSGLYAALYALDRS
ncbi:peptidase M14 [Mesotoga sp. Brook.08.105.5.1]|uniref:M14 family zinc carboxypeptidase n=1 Tax=Mesotoga sp. Brook.08.105.5.1 TaxID=1421002 RepID=UPI000C58D900|nr:M14 family zinc carboxypeptidase [Mesotoga sp. Brook.08.105.5.1]PVD18077.1 peptidase M14 [Mesotoga sp. Brook.08.105.5.1]